MPNIAVRVQLQAGVPVIGQIDKVAKPLFRTELLKIARVRKVTSESMVLEYGPQYHMLADAEIRKTNTDRRSSIYTNADATLQQLCTLRYAFKILLKQVIGGLFEI